MHQVPESASVNQQLKHILLIEGDVDESGFLKAILSDQYEISLTKDGDEGYLIARTKSPDLVLLDLLLPNFDSIEICGLLRSSEATRQIPIIVLSGSNDFEMQLKAFEMGADDVVQKPFRPRELLARISSKIRRSHERTRSPAVLRCGDLEMDIDRFECRVGQRQVSFSVLEFNLLRFFIENFNRVISREKILSAVWEDAMVKDRTVDAHMASLRKKLESSRSNLIFVTRYGAGYALKDRKEKRG